MDKELVEDALDRMIWVANQGSPRKPGDGSDFDRVITILQNFLDTGTVDENTENNISQQVSDSAYDFMNEPSCLVTKVEDGQVTVTGKNIDTRATWTTVIGNTPYDITDDDRRWADEAIQKHDDSQIPVRSREANIQAIKDALAKDPGKIFISPLLDPEDKPDPRCNGCEFQHPFAELLSYDRRNQLVYCGRDTNPSYHSEGRKLRHPPGTEKPQGIKMCHIYYLDKGTLIKYGADSHLNTSEAFSKQTVELELNNKYAILDILDMLMEHAKYHIEALSIDSKVFTMPLMFDAENLKNRLTGEK